MGYSVILTVITGILLSQGNLLYVESDIREAGTLTWMETASIVHLEADCFLAVSEMDPPSSLHWQLIDTAPLNLDEYRILYSALYRGSVPDIDGEIVLETDDFLLIRLPEPSSDPVEIEGIGILRPLRIYHESILEPSPDYRTADTVLVNDIVAAVDQDSITALVQHMEDYGTRHMFSPEYDACADWADTWMAAHYISSELQTFVYSGDSMSNVIGEITGTENPDDIYIICGHLDSMSGNPDVAPGADDNASGSAAVLEAVRVMSPYTYRNTIRFVLFAAEEAWMVGSEYYVANAYAQGDNILGAINLDMVLYAPGISDSVFIPYDAQSEPLALAAGAMFENYSPSITPRIIYDPGAPSDHASFWLYGYTAIEVAEASAEEIWGGYNPYYHQATDLLANYLPSFPYGTDMIRASIGLFATLAEPVGPSGIEGGVSDPLFLSIFPNPAGSGAVSVRATGANTSGDVFTIVDISGRAVATGVLSGTGEASVVIDQLPSGVYSLVLHSHGSEPARFVVLK